MPVALLVFIKTKFYIRRSAMILFHKTTGELTVLLQACRSRDISVLCARFCGK